MPDDLKHGGMSSTNGRRLSGVAHLRQSVTDILLTPLGSRVMYPEYGSKLFEWLDSPLEQEQLVEIYAATAMAIERWEPRLRLTRVYATGDSASPGHLIIDLEGIYIPNYQNLRSARSVRLESIAL